MMRKKWSAAAALAGVTLSLAACSGGGGTGSATPAIQQDSSSAISVWVADTLAGPAKAYLAAHPEIKADVQTIDNSPGAIPSRIALATKAGKGVPDVVFLTNPADIASLVANPVNYALALNGKVQQSVLDGFAKGSISRCTFNGNAYCLPNDIAPTVLFYNKALFAKFGYTVPTTFDEWLALSKKVAAEHPGYSLGSVSAAYGLDAYFGSSQCDVDTSSSPTEVTINTASTKCTRVTDVIGPMMANKTLSTLQPFDKAFTPTVKSGKLLATISPAWMGDYGIKPNYPNKGEWAVAPMPTWSGASTNYSGTVGGGTWVVSAKSKNQAAALKFAQAMSTDVSIQSKESTFPADKASAAAWLKSVSADTWYASDPSSVFTEAAGKMSPSLGYVRYETQLNDAFNSTIVKSNGSDISSALQQFGAQATSAAQAAGYTVSK